eukprot:TRINITY_DN4836_c0_g2_i2.p1 TRINITY_DN4836_c0_g2~~TRINITY_DN4836_c0_g2_i2.p1  ORF type:complete len:112 (+),score=5.60 TRINITY_DN4836_c0_g2_i2:800-1135(+)
MSLVGVLHESSQKFPHNVPTRNYSSFGDKYSLKRSFAVQITSIFVDFASLIFPDRISFRSFFVTFNTYCMSYDASLCFKRVFSALHCILGELAPGRTSLTDFCDLFRHPHP